MKPTGQEHDAAMIAGETCRRAGGKRTQNPYRNVSTEPGLTLKDAWESGWERFDRWMRAR